MPSPHLTIHDYSGLILAVLTKPRLTDAPDIAAVGQDLLALPDRHPRISLVVDLSPVEAMSSQMLAKLVALHKAVLAGKGRMTLCGTRPAIMELFTVTKLHKVLRFAPEAQGVIMEYQRKK